MSWDPESAKCDDDGHVDCAVGLSEGFEETDALEMCRIVHCWLFLSLERRELVCEGIVRLKIRPNRQFGTESSGF